MQPKNSLHLQIYKQETVSQWSETSVEQTFIAVLIENKFTPNAPLSSPSHTHTQSLWHKNVYVYIRMKAQTYEHDENRQDKQVN